MRGESEFGKFQIDEPPCITEGSERRAMCQALREWLEIFEKSGSLPSVHELHPNAIPDHREHLFLVDLTARAEHCLIIYSGRTVMDFCGQDAVNRLACDIFPPPLDEQVPHLCEAVRTFGKPIPHTGTAFAPPGEIAYRAVFMPLAENEGETEVRHVLGSITFRLV